MLTITKQDNRYYFKGQINEYSDFSSVEVQSSENLIFNLKNIERINSNGLKNWANFLEKLKDSVIILEECSILIADQLIYAPFFLGHAKLESVYIPYYCDNCVVEVPILLNQKSIQNFKSSQSNPHLCPHCQSELDYVDDINIINHLISLLHKV